MRTHRRHTHLARSFAVVLLGASALASCAEEGRQASPYDVTPVPAVPDRTSEPSDGVLADGQYWTQEIRTGDSEGTLVATLVRAYFGPACVEALGADACAVEPGVATEPASDVVIDIAEVILVSVVDDDRRNYSVPVTELIRLVAGESPDPLAPEGYVFGDDPFLLTVRDGVVTELAQIWID
jgi:hypothetical protein